MGAAYESGFELRRRPIDVPREHAPVPPGKCSSVASLRVTPRAHGTPGKEERDHRAHTLHARRETVRRDGLVDAQLELPCEKLQSSIEGIVEKPERRKA